MAFIDIVLEEPSYGWSDKNGELVIPRKRQLIREAFRRINIFKDKRNWMSLTPWLMILCMVPMFVIFITQYFSWWLLAAMIIYAMVIMGTHGTIWLHRYCTHKAYKFSHPFWRFLVQNLVIKTLPEELYAVSHHVHHSKSDMPGDPYNSRAGLMYCLLSDVNHQNISKTLSENEYHKAARLVTHTGIVINSYRTYQRWGSIVSPLYALFAWLLNWAFWYTAFYFIGGHALALALFSGAMLWYMFVPAFNYTGHGKGKEKHVDGLDFDRSNLAVNQSRPGLLTGEWHNNHHLYPGSARAGFLRNQVDLAWIFIWCMHRIKVVASYHDSKKDFLKKYYMQSKTTK